jgi:DNA polymerase/3'-5' exonuclease PolX
MIPLDYATEIAEKTRDLLEPYCLRIEIAGSIRRKKPEVKDVEIVLIPMVQDLPQLKKQIDQWEKKKGTFPCLYTQRRLPESIDLDLFVATPDNWGLQLAIRTGPANYSHHVLAMGWSKKGYHSKGGILYPTSKVYGQDRLDYSKPLYLREEIDVFSFIGLPWKEPQDRI